MVELRDHQDKVLGQLRPGAILQGGVGSGKSITALAFYYIDILGGEIKPFTKPKHAVDLYIITTAKKRDALEWDGELARFSLSTNTDVSIGGIKVVVDSWNNIQKYKDAENAFFIFDEQRLIGAGAWAKTFITISKKNRWLMLTATPGDAWIDYAPVFIANGFYKNRTEFIVKHVVYSRFSKYPKIDRYVDCDVLIKHRENVVVQMLFKHAITRTSTDLILPFDKKAMDIVIKKRWNPFTNKPIKNASEFAFAQRKIVNSDPSRLDALKEVHDKHKKLIVFYNFNYELFLLRIFLELEGIAFAEWNGHHHDALPETDNWVYLVQYTAGAEAWECVTTNAIYFYSLNYSYRINVQAAGRIDRLNTPFTELHYYYAKSDSLIDRRIAKAIKEKRNFNEREYESEFA